MNMNLPNKISLARILLIPVFVAAFFLTLDYNFVSAPFYKKLLFVADKENNNLNNHLLHLIRQNVQYFEKVHGRINTQNIELPEKQDT